MSKKFLLNILEIETVNDVHYLAFLVDNRLSFEIHINFVLKRHFVLKRLSRFCSLLYRMRTLFQRKHLYNYYNSFMKVVIHNGV